MKSLETVSVRMTKLVRNKARRYSKWRKHMAWDRNQEEVNQKLLRKLITKWRKSLRCKMLFLSRLKVFTWRLQTYYQLTSQGNLGVTIRMWILHITPKHELLKWILIQGHYWEVTPITAQITTLMLSNLGIVVSVREPRAKRNQPWLLWF